MQLSHEELIARAAGLLGVCHTFRHGERVFTIAMLRRYEDWRPLEASWWRGKQVTLIGADVDGNFFLRHSDGTVRYWDHREQTDTVIARSVREFVMGIK